MAIDWNAIHDMSDHEAAQVFTNLGYRLTATPIRVTELEIVVEPGPFAFPGAEDAFAAFLAGHPDLAEIAAPHVRRLRFMRDYNDIILKMDDHENHPALAKELAAARNPAP